MGRAVINHTEIVRRNYNAITIVCYRVITCLGEKVNVNSQGEPRPSDFYLKFLRHVQRIRGFANAALMSLADVTENSVVRSCVASAV